MSIRTCGGAAFISSKKDSCQIEMPDYNHGSWIDSIIASVRSRIMVILRIWDDIGLEKRQLENRKDILKGHIDILLETMISEEEKSVAQLRKSVADLEVCQRFGYCYLFS